MEKLQEINESLTQLQEDFDRQISVIGSDKTEFHDVLIELSAKYPEHKELLSFIVHISDKLETNQTIFVDVVSDTLTELIKNKNALVKKIISERKIKFEDTGSIWGKAKSITTFFKNSKIILTALAIIAIAGAVIIEPQAFLAVIKALTSLL